MKLIPQSVTRTIARQILLSKKNSPHIFFVGGVIGIIGSGVLACRATLKLEDTLDEVKKDLDIVKALHDNPAPGSQYPEQEHHKDLGYVYGKSAVHLGRLYGPAIALGAVSIAALTGSHIQMTRRNTALTATLAAVSKAYDEYRIRVQGEIGKERELDIHRSIKEEKNDKKELLKVTDPNGWSPYARFFDESCPNWVKDAELNRIFLQCQQTYANHLLRARGHVFLNEVYDSLGLERSRAGQVVGWVINGEGDGYVDFGMFEANSNRFINNLERNIILDFNVDGVVYDKI